MKTVKFPIFLSLVSLFILHKVFCFQEVILGTRWENIVIFIISIDRSTGEISVSKFSRKTKTPPCRSRAGV